MPNDRLDGGAAAHLAADRGGDAAHLAADPDAKFLGVGVAAIAFVDVDAAVATPVSASSSAITGPKVWPSKGLPCRALACTNWPPLGLLAGVATDELSPKFGDGLKNQAAAWA
jgi:hypothetical protein